MIVGTCGFGETGSSAITDFLKEFDSFQVLDNIEFTWVSANDGLIDLDNHINNPHGRTGESIIAIHRYKELCNRYVSRLGKVGISQNDFLNSVDELINSIETTSWWWEGPEFVGLSYWNRKFRKLIMRTIVRKWEIKNGKQWEGYPYFKVQISVKPENFDVLARKHVMDVIGLSGLDVTKPIALDQPFSGNNPQASFKYFEDPYAIVVDRDPRDLYTFTKTKLLHSHIYHIMPSNTVEDFVKYYKALRVGQPYRLTNERVLNINFEDLVYHYDETSEKIRSFLHLGENPAPKTIFDPSVSIVNTQVWKRFPEFADDIAYIEKELSDYLFDYTGCPEPDPNTKMFYGMSKKNNAYKKPKFG